MIEKKLILCSILAISIGIATIIPLQYLMTAEAQTNADTIAEAQDAIAEAQAITEATKVEPWYNVDVTYAYCNPNEAGANDTATWSGVSIKIVANFTLIPEALKNAEAQVEYYKFAVSSEQGPITDLYYYIAQTNDSSFITFISGWGTVGFANGLTYNGPHCSGGQGGQYHDHFVGNYNYTMGFLSSNYNEEEAAQIVTQIRNAQTLYIDVSKASTVKVTDNFTVTEPASDEVIQHIELTKVSDGFLFGGYKQGTMPLPVEMPHSTT